MARMNIEDVIHELERRHPDCTRGKTAKPGSEYYEAASGLEFHACACARNNPAYFRGYAEFVAEGRAGGCHSVTVNRNRRIINCGRKGYHATKRPICSL
jgi:hypothetical protein